MNARQYSNEEILVIVQEEGIGYAVESYTGPASIADPKLRTLWAEARQAIRGIHQHLAETVKASDG